MDKSKQLDLIKFLLMPETNANQINDAGFNPLMILVLNNYTGDIEQLLSWQKLI